MRKLRSSILSKELGRVFNKLKKDVYMTLNFFLTKSYFGDDKLAQWKTWPYRKTHQHGERKRERENVLVCSGYCNKNIIDLVAYK